MAPSPSRVREIFHPLSIQGSQRQFFENHVIDDVDWTVKGHSPMSGHYTSREEFLAATLAVLGNQVLTEPVRLRVVNVVSSGGDEEDGEVVVEMEAVDAVCRNGLTYDMVYNWVCRFEKGKIVQVRAYVDSELLTRAVAQNQ